MDHLIAIASTTGLFLFWKSVVNSNLIENYRCSPYFSISSRPIEQFPLSTVVVLLIIVVSLSIFTTFLLEISLEKHRLSNSFYVDIGFTR